MEENIEEKIAHAARRSRYDRFHALRLRDGQYDLYVDELSTYMNP